MFSHLGERRQRKEALKDMFQRMTRYVITELLKVFLLALTAMTLLMVVIGLAQQAVREGLGPTAILRLIPFILPNALRFAIPGTILFAACSVYGRMSASNEIVAIKSAGVSPWVVAWPALVLAFAMSCISVWLNDVAVSWGRAGVHRVVLQSVEQIMYSVLRTQKSYSTNQFAINVVDVQDRYLILPTITFHGAKGGPPLTLTAKRAELNYNSSEDSLTLRMLDSQFDMGDQEEEGWSGDWPNELTHKIPLTAASRKGAMGTGPSEFPLREISSKAREQKLKIEALEQQLAVEAGYQMMSGDFHALADNQWEQQHRNLENSRIMLHRLNTEPWRRWAYGFSCFVFVLVGTGLAIWLRNADFWTTFGLCFLPILITYYPLLEYGVGRAKCGALPPYSVWIANAVMLGVGLVILKKTMKH